MKWSKRIFFGLAFAALAGTAAAGEDSTTRWHCTGPNWWDSSQGLQGFVPAQSDCGAVSPRY